MRICNLGVGIFCAIVLSQLSVDLYPSFVSFTRENLRRLNYVVEMEVH